MIEIGDIVRTSYGTGPYRVVEVKHGCDCPSYFDGLEFMGRPDKARRSKPHCHMLLVKASCPVGKEPRRGETMAGYYWLNGYDESGASVWNSDKLFVEGKAPGMQLRLFD